MTKRGRVVWLGRARPRVCVRLGIRARVGIDIRLRFRFPLAFAFSRSHRDRFPRRRSNTMAHSSNMEEFLSIVFGAPTLGWTIALLVALIYWVTVILGALDVKVLGGGDAHKGDLSADGHGHDHASDGHGTDALGAKEGALAALISALKLRSVPVTVSLSLIFLFGWIVSFQASRWLTPLLPEGPLLAKSIVTLLSLSSGVLGASLAVRPLAPLFRVRSGPRHTELIGKTVRVTTGRVDTRFGEAELDDRGAGLRLQVRCENAEALARGDEALILGWSESEHAFEVEPMHEVERRMSRGE